MKLSLQIEGVEGFMKGFSCVHVGCCFECLHVGLVFSLRACCGRHHWSMGQWMHSELFRLLAGATLFWNVANRSGIHCPTRMTRALLDQICMTSLCGL